MLHLIDSIFDTSTLNMLGIDKDFMNSFKDSLLVAEEERLARAKKAWEEERKSFKWVFEKIEHTKEFDKKYQGAERFNVYALVNTETGTKHLSFSISNDYDVKKLEKELNSQRFVVLSKYYEGKYDESIMVSCHGKNWRHEKGKYTGNPITPYYLSTYEIIFDTKVGQVIYETDKSHSHRAYITFYDNLCKIIQESHKTVYFDMPSREVVLESSDDTIETKDNIIVGKSHNYGTTREPAIVINKHTCSTYKID